MFKHHKYCVIEVSGLLVAIEDPAGPLNVYLLDGADGAASRHLAGDTDVKIKGLPPAGDKSQRVRITDPGLIEFICRVLQRRDGECQFGCQARVTGTVGVDGGEVQLSYVSQAFIHDKERLLKYEPHQSGTQGNSHDCQ